MSNINESVVSSEVKPQSPNKGCLYTLYRAFSFVFLFFLLLFLGAFLFGQTRFYITGLFYYYTQKAPVEEFSSAYTEKLKECYVDKYNKPMAWKIFKFNEKHQPLKAIPEIGPVLQLIANIGTSSANSAYEEINHILKKEQKKIERAFFSKFGDSVPRRQILCLKMATCSEWEAAMFRSIFMCKINEADLGVLYYSKKFSGPDRSFVHDFNSKSSENLVPSPVPSSSLQNEKKKRVSASYKRRRKRKKYKRKKLKAYGKIVSKNVIIFPRKKITFFHVMRNSSYKIRIRTKEANNRRILVIVKNNDRVILKYATKKREEKVFPVQQGSLQIEIKNNNFFVKKELFVSAYITK